MNDKYQLPIKDMAVAVAKGKTWGSYTSEQVLGLMLVADAYGVHPMRALEHFHIMQDGKAAKKAISMQSDFQAAGGTIEWEQLDNTAAVAIFSMPNHKSFKFSYTIEDAKLAGLYPGKNDKNGNPSIWSKDPRSMLRNRCISQGLRAFMPGATSGMYTPDECAEIIEADYSMVPTVTDISHQIETPPVQGEGKKDVADRIITILAEHQDRDDLREICKPLGKNKASTLHITVPMETLVAVRDALEAAIITPEIQEQPEGEQNDGTI